MRQGDKIEVTDPTATGYGRTGTIVGEVQTPRYDYDWRVQLDDTRHPFPLAYRTRELAVLEPCRNCGHTRLLNAACLCPVCDREDLAWHELHTPGGW